MNHVVARLFGPRSLMASPDWNWIGVPITAASASESAWVSVMSWLPGVRYTVPRWLGPSSPQPPARPAPDPDPVYAADGAQPGSQGDKVAPAVKRYRMDTVKAVQTLKTSNSSTGGGAQ